MRRFLVVALAALVVTGSAVAQDIAGGGSSTFVQRDGKTERVGDVFAEVEWQMPIGESRFLTVAALAGFGESGGGFLGFGGKHWWMASEGVYPGLGVDLFYLNGGQSIVEETSLFFGPVASLELLSEAYPVSIRPFVAWYPAITGDDVTLFRFGIRLEDESSE